MSRGRIGALLLALAVLIASPGALAQKSLAPGALVEVSYGSDAKQTLAFSRPNLNRPTAVVLFVHGGGWTIGDKARNAPERANWLARQGWAYATANYRLVPEATVEQQAADIASAVAWMRSDGRRYGLDPDRIVLMGHSAGAHLAALVASDPRYLRAAGVPLGVIKGVILLDGAGYDVPAQMRDNRNRTKVLYRRAFSTDPKRQAALSPIAHAAAPNARDWLIMPVERRADAVAQSRAFAAALQRSGAQVQVKPQATKTHRTLNSELGRSGDASTTEIDEFLRSIR